MSPMPDPVEGPSEEMVERAARAICVGRSDDWGDLDDRENARDDARAALEAPAPRLAELEAVAEAARDVNQLAVPIMRIEQETVAEREAWYRASDELDDRLSDLDYDAVPGAAIAHDAEIVSDFIGGGWTATCSCGWASDLKANSGLAQLALSNHRRAPLNG